MFINALLMLVIPLVMTSMIASITGLGDVRQLGGIGGKTIFFYTVTTGLAVLLRPRLSLLSTWIFSFKSFRSFFFEYMELLIAIFLSGIIAGFVDAIAGGGGTIMLPSLILTGLPVATAIATNKLCGTCGSLTSSLKFALVKQIDWQACFLMGIPAIFGAWLGSRSIDFLPKVWAEPLVILLMVLITLFIVFKPNFGLETSLKKKFNPNKKQITQLILFGLIIGFHDGFFGPGTGTFLVFALISILSLDFLRGTGSAKVMNLMTNITALISFWILGEISFPEGISGAIGVAFGSYLGSTFATLKGAKFIKPIFVTVTTILVAKLLWQYVSR